MNFEIYHDFDLTKFPHFTELHTYFPSSIIAQKGYEIQSDEVSFDGVPPDFRLLRERR
jgi:hypothetical protein